MKKTRKSQQRNKRKIEQNLNFTTEYNEKFKTYVINRYILNGRMEVIEKGICELKDKTMKIIQSEET